MSEIVVVITFLLSLRGGVLPYSFFSTSGYEEDENKNYVPDRLERIFGKKIKLYNYFLLK